MAQSAVPEEAMLRLIASLDDDQRQALNTLCTQFDGEIFKGLLTSYNKQPSVFNNITLDDLAEEPVLDYITDLEVRQKLFFRIKFILQKVQSNFEIDMAFVAVFMVAPIDVLQSRLDALKENIRHNHLDMVHEFFSDCEKTILPSILGYVNKRGRRSTSQSNSAKSLSVQSTSPGPPLPVQISAHTSPDISSPSSSRISAAARLCKRRDYDKCILTKYNNPEAVNIFPIAAANDPQTLSRLVALLAIFWGDDAANQLLTLAQCRDTIESPQNLLSLNHQLHAWFDSAKMALKPLRKLDDGSVVVQFHWLKAGRLRPAQRQNDVDLDLILAKAGLGSITTWGYMLAHRASGLRLKTGQVFTLTANDSAHMPNFDLLQLSWDLRRIISICGVVVEENVDDDGDNDDYYNDDYYSDNDDGSSIGASEVQWRHSITEKQVEQGVEPTVTTPRTATVRTITIRLATLGKGAEFLVDLLSWTLVTTGNSASLSAAIVGGGHIDAIGRNALAGLCGGKEGKNGDDGG
ncbi:hypothetical protein TRIATDRAFT_303832 [Trichoderma atroviride IMI 206040]|uniref:HNH nuclease domain-containing protein n=1 Tax=Hypocrea atroviridis (strain ATCC 20476 / IMI 206040) TaxID=452589 RepID=G9NG44_HYPAI|nr:uncharacterized protein TRIATDRAFT_303832 [Trichoderma atroviride IMI 206040]EHK50256.1 hypothetical protein TRIATDRAFT_303832 [Trichoderma atroviride IMI 206040]